MALDASQALGSRVRSSRGSKPELPCACTPRLGFTFNLHIFIYLFLTKGLTEQNKLTPLIRPELLQGLRAERPASEPQALPKSLRMEVNVTSLTATANLISSLTGFKDVNYF